MSKEETFATHLYIMNIWAVDKQKDKGHRWQQAYNIHQNRNI